MGEWDGATTGGGGAVGARRVFRLSGAPDAWPQVETSTAAPISAARQEAIDGLDMALQREDPTAFEAQKYRELYGGAVLRVGGNRIRHADRIGAGTANA